MSKDSKPKKKYKDKHEAFLAVVTPRVNKALKAIELIGNQAGAAYAPTPAEIDEMFTVLRNKVAEIEHQYKGGGSQVMGFAFNSK